MQLQSHKNIQNAFPNDISRIKKKNYKELLPGLAKRETASENAERNFVTAARMKQVIEIKYFFLSFNCWKLIRANLKVFVMFLLGTGLYIIDKRVFLFYFCLSGSKQLVCTVLKGIMQNYGADQRTLPTLFAEWLSTNVILFVFVA